MCSPASKVPLNVSTENWICFLVVHRMAELVQVPCWILFCSKVDYPIKNNHARSIYAFCQQDNVWYWGMDSICFPSLNSRMTMTPTLGCHNTNVTKNGYENQNDRSLSCVSEAIWEPIKNAGTRDENRGLSLLMSKPLSSETPQKRRIYLRKRGMRNQIPFQVSFVRMYTRVSFGLGYLIQLQ